MVALCSHTHTDVFFFPLTLFECVFTSGLKASGSVGFVAYEGAETTLVVFMCLTVCKHGGGPNSRGLDLK